MWFGFKSLGKDRPATPPISPFSLTFLINRFSKRSSPRCVQSRDASCRHRDSDSSVVRHSGIEFEGGGMSQDGVNDRWEEFLDPQILRTRLISASLFLAAFEILKDAVIGRIRNFFCLGFDEQ